jgi:hypothetical protein
MRIGRLLCVGIRSSEPGSELLQNDMESRYQIGTPS